MEEGRKVAAPVGPLQPYGAAKRRYRFRSQAMMPPRMLAAV